MKTQKLLYALLASAFLQLSFAQDRTTVTATNTDISDNLNLKAVASIFGDASNLEDFERRLNDPKTQISNLDLNNDNQVDYLRVIESTSQRTHLIIIQAVLEKDIYQDVATVEVEKDAGNVVQVQVVGNTYIYGSNYIYEPIYVRTPLIYNYFWVNSYQPYYSSYYWGYYPNYYYAWNPYPIYRYRSNVNIYINNYNHYNYVNVRRSHHAAKLYDGRRSNGYEVQHPNRSFAVRNGNVKNRYELDQTRINAVPRTGMQASNPRIQSPVPSKTTDVRNNGYSMSTRSNLSSNGDLLSNDVKFSNPRNTPIQNAVPNTRVSDEIKIPSTRQTVNSNSAVRTPIKNFTTNASQIATPRNQDYVSPRTSTPRTSISAQNSTVRQNAQFGSSNISSGSSNVNANPRQSQPATRAQVNASPRSVASPSRQQEVTAPRVVPQASSRSNETRALAPNIQRSIQNTRR